MALTPMQRVKLERLSRCGLCNGRGRYTSSRRVLIDPCPACGGTGRVTR